MPDNYIYALDFDGVICDSAVETSITGWKAAQKLWPEMLISPIDDKTINDFRTVRPYLETGYEAILIVRLLYTKTSVADLCQHYEQYIKQLLTSEQLDVAQLKTLFGETRDAWICEDEADWLVHNPLFTGIAEKLRSTSPDHWFVITTKQERFVKRILQGNDIAFHKSHIYGMDRGLSKQYILLNLCESYPNSKIVFIEDRLPTLTGILTNPVLSSIQLQLATWGYNTAEQKEQGKQYALPLIDPEGFLQPI